MQETCSFVLSTCFQSFIQISKTRSIVYRQSWSRVAFFRTSFRGLTESHWGNRSYCSARAAFTKYTSRVEATTSSGNSASSLRDELARLFNTTFHSPKGIGYLLGASTRIGYFTAMSMLALRIVEDMNYLRKPSATFTPAFRNLILNLIKECLTACRQDYENIQLGYYKMPMLPTRSWESFLTTTINYFLDVRLVQTRRLQNSFKEFQETSLKLEDYPDYYRRNFHFQTDGYLSDYSAKLYEYQVEVLFNGSADMMRRQTLVPLYHYLKAKPIKQMKLLHVACGTGGVLADLLANYPSLRITNVDLSPFYLREAMRRHWHQDAYQQFICAKAEQLPFGDHTFDVLLNIYLFHELPPQVRVAAAKEFFRVLKPGGLFIFADSIQEGDRVDLNRMLQLFPQLYHEPYYPSYIKTDLTSLFEAVGFQHRTQYFSWVTKVCVYFKPNTSSKNSSDE